MKYTKGKWKYNEVRDNSPFNGMFVIHNEDEDFAYVEDYNDPYDHEKKEANAKLISKAPIFYEYIEKKAKEGCEEAQGILSSL